MFEELRTYGTPTPPALYDWYIRGRVNTDGRTLHRFDGLRARIDFAWFALRRKVAAQRER